MNTYSTPRDAGYQTNSQLVWCCAHPDGARAQARDASSIHSWSYSQLVRCSSHLDGCEFELGVLLVEEEGAQALTLRRHNEEKRE